MRTPAQRRAAALAEVARRAVGAEPGRPTIAVTIGLDDLAGTDRFGPRRRDRSAPSAPETARRLSCDANVVRVVTNGASEPLDVGPCEPHRVARAAPSAHHPRPRVRVPGL